MSLRYIKTQRKCRNGGICANCESEYIGSPAYEGHSAEKGFRVLLETKDGIVEPYNLCRTCKEKAERETRI